MAAADLADTDVSTVTTNTQPASAAPADTTLSVSSTSTAATSSAFGTASSAESYPYYGSTNAVPGLGMAGMFHPMGVYASVAPLTSCTMQCMNMGLAAMKESKTSPSGVAGTSMSYSCMQGCHNGLNPFMFNWAHPGMPGNLEAWGSLHGSLGAIPPVLGAPVDGASCVMQCMAMGGEAMAASMAQPGATEPTSDDKQRMWLSCQHGCVAGSPFMFNWTYPAAPGDIAPYAANPFLSSNPAVWAHPYAMAPAYRPQNHASCVMMCLSLGKDAMDQDCLLNPALEKCKKKGGLGGLTGTKKRRLRRRRLLMTTPKGAAAKPKPCTSEADCKEKRDVASQKVSQSCMQGCSVGIPFMFNWTAPLFPGVPAMTSYAAGGAGSPSFSASIFGGGMDSLHASPLSPFNTLTAIASGPTDHASCVMQCLSMGHDAAKRNDEFIKAHEKEAKKLGMQFVTPLARSQMVLSCGRGCDAGTPFMFNFTAPSMPGLPQVPDDPKMPFGTSWNAPLLPGLPPVPLYPKFMSPGGAHHAFYGNVYNFSHPFYPFMGHPNGAAGAFQSAGKGHMVCMAKQVAAFMQDSVYKSEKKNSPKRNAGLADFVRPCQVYVMVQFGPKFGVEGGTRPPLPGSGVTGFGNLRGGHTAPRFGAQSGGDSQNMDASLGQLGLFMQASERVMHRQRRRGRGARRRRQGFVPSGGASALGGDKEASAVTSVMTPGSNIAGLYVPAAKASGVHLSPLPVAPQNSPLEAARQASMALAAAPPGAALTATSAAPTETVLLDRQSQTKSMTPSLLDFRYPTVASAVEGQQ